MRNPFLVLVFLFSSFVSLSGQQVFYSAAKAGLNLREKPDAASSIITKIPYGQKVDLLNEGYHGTLKTEGMEANWRYINFQGKKGYVADAYILSIPPPSLSDGDVENYLKSFTREKCRWEKEINPNGEENYRRLEKVMYENGIMVNTQFYYESFNESIILNEFTFYQAFVLVRLLYAESGYMKIEGAFPAKSFKPQTQNEIEINIRYEYNRPTYISFSQCDAGCYTVEIEENWGEVIITVSGGV
ncbi:MAG: SH3 domain-containing protein [Flavobacteriales bacterium]|nr:SH3 domain-containing protein [Flavobacteriales bacterium]